MKDSDGNKIKASSMTPYQAMQVIEKMTVNAKKKIHKRALEYAIDWSNIAQSGPPRPKMSRAAKA